jgi:hypothetical protein
MHPDKTKLTLTELGAHFLATFYLPTVCIALLRILLVSGQRVHLKLCFQVFIVLSPADEAGVHEGAWGRCGSGDL